MTQRPYAITHLRDVVGFVGHPRDVHRQLVGGLREGAIRTSLPAWQRFVCPSEASPPHAADIEERLASYSRLGLDFADHFREALLLRGIYLDVVLALGVHATYDPQTIMSVFAEKAHVEQVYGISVGCSLAHAISLYVSGTQLSAVETRKGEYVVRQTHPQSPYPIHRLGSLETHLTEASAHIRDPYLAAMLVRQVMDACPLVKPIDGVN